MTQFSDFALLPALQQALTAEGYTKPTPIQAQALGPALQGRDLLGIAQTGTGKTAAFALPILNRLATTNRPKLPRSCRALILSPTRELASQIADSFRSYGRNLKLSTEVVFGGLPIGRQIRALSVGVDILVATPGRLLDLINQRAVSLRDIEVLVLDEADQMLDLGFIVPLKRIVPMLPKTRQSLFFSATMPRTIASLADEFLTNPVKVAVAPVSTTAERVTQGVMFCDVSKKPALLLTLLDDVNMERVLVFSRTKHGADRVVKQLAAGGVQSAAIHGNKSQPQREKALASFKSGETRVLIATDIAARGIDVEGVTHVINFDLPNTPESYVHRIGRTARAGAAGIAIAFCANEERPYLRDIERLTRLPIPVLAMPDGFAEKAANMKPLPRETYVDERSKTQRPQRTNNPQRQGAPRPGQGAPRSDHGSRPQHVRTAEAADGELRVAPDHHKADRNVRAATDAAAHRRRRRKRNGAGGGGQVRAA